MGLIATGQPTEIENPKQKRREGRRAEMTAVIGPICRHLKQWPSPTLFDLIIDGMVLGGQDVPGEYLAAQIQNRWKNITSPGILAKRERNGEISGLVSDAREAWKRELDSRRCLNLAADVQKVDTEAEQAKWLDEIGRAKEKLIAEIGNSTFEDRVRNRMARLREAWPDRTESEADLRFRSEIEVATGFDE